MHCVYTAFQHHMTYLNEPGYLKVYEKYKQAKEFSHGGFGQYTFAGVLPWLYWQMLFTHNLNSKRTIEMRLERSYITLPEYMPSANDVQREIIFKHTGYWGIEVDEITLEPAVYCLLNEQHAQFSLVKPDWKGARVIMAFQLVVAHENLTKLGESK